MQNTIAVIRKSKGISQKDLAKRLGITHWWLNHVESGKRRPSTELLEKVAKELDVSIKDLFLE